MQADGEMLNVSTLKESQTFGHGISQVLFGVIFAMSHHMPNNIQGIREG